MLQKLKRIAGELKRLREQATAQGRATGRVEREQGRVATMREGLAALVMEV